jgi:hypothetical protein
LSRGALESARLDRLAQLAQQRAPHGVGVDQPRGLHADRRGAADDLPRAQVVCQRAKYADVVDAAVAKEARVLHGDRRRDQLRRDALEGHPARAFSAGVDDLAERSAMTIEEAGRSAGRGQGFRWKAGPCSDELDQQRRHQRSAEQR